MKNNFDPSGVGVPNGNYFGFPFTPEEAKLVLISVPWDVTTSYRPGTSNGPISIIEASTQLDFYDFHLDDAWKCGIGTLKMNDDIFAQNAWLRPEAEKVIKHLEEGGSEKDLTIREELDSCNKGSEIVNNYVYKEATEWISKGKIVGLVGGDHSTPLGLIKALSEKHEDMGILQIDAHADLRIAYEGFKYSHASIMHNVLAETNVKSLTQVGIRDISIDEINYIKNDNRVFLFDDFKLKDDIFRGASWLDITDRIISTLPETVYISFDIDGLSPELCPNTGTPVPGGLSFNEAVFLIRRIVEKGRRIIGFDLCEVSCNEDDEWDANVGARILYKLCNQAFKSNLKD